ncbi:MAG TPA: nicotinate phosphoribosyltransferase [Candidatus Dormibacteraeota bacterium]|nr:nicotinate phosphoribosyltransferase [Candidatus Dormibacteraeota bacterium]
MRPATGFTDDPPALFCDEYALTMAQSFWRHGQDERCTFELVARSLPEHRGYLVAAGLEQVVWFLQNFRFADSDLEQLRTRQLFDAAFLEHLASTRFHGDLNAVAEGTVVGAETPLLQVIAPRVQATLVEAALLATVNHQTSIASKTARIVDAASGRPVWDFSLRRVHGMHAGLGVARAAYIAGAAGTATEIAGTRLGIPTTGTMAHHYVLRFGPNGEQAAFEQFLRDYPGRAVLLVDTFDTLRGVDRAVAASRATGVPLGGVRLDSGDLLKLSLQTRVRLDAAGMHESRIVASGDLDEYSISHLVRAGAPINSFGVGTALGTSADAPALGGVYKLVAEEQAGVMQPVMKLSAHKANDPGMHQVFRTAAGDVLAMAGEQLDGEPLLLPVLREGRQVAELPSLDELRARGAEQRELLPAEVRRIDSPHAWAVRRSEMLQTLRRQLSGSDA